jgi:D-alanyl-lipoteichoic acid acyltransferase DltB (MBOAT superfamily)
LGLAFLISAGFSTFFDYYTGIQIEKAKSENSRKFWFWLSISMNLGFGILNITTFLQILFSTFEWFWTANESLLNVVLPVGISFYTFHGLSYVIDIYLKNKSQITL